MYNHLLIALILLTISCQRNIDITPAPYQNEITIESLLEPGEQLKVYVHTSIGFFDPAFFSEDAFIFDALVEVNENELYVDSTYSDFWCRHNYFYTDGENIVEDREYNLKVEYDGAVYEAQTKTDVLEVNFDSIAYVPEFLDRYLDLSQGIALYFQDPIGVNQYRFFMTREVDENTIIEDDFEYSSKCLNGNTTVINDVGRFIEFDEDKGDGVYTKIIMEPSHSFVEGDQITVRLQSLNKDAAQYLDLLEDLKLFGLNPFVEPIRHKYQIDGALGFFGSSRKSTTQMTITMPEASM